MSVEYEAQIMKWLSGETSAGESVPLSNSSWQEAVWVELPFYQLITKEIDLARLSIRDMDGLICEGLN